MTIDEQALGEYVRAVSQLRMYDHAEREPLWEKRLKLNADELARLPKLADTQEAPFRVLASAASSVSIPADAPCLASAKTAREQGTNPGALVEDALVRAKETRSHNVFTYLDENAGQAGDRDLTQGPLAGIPIAVKDLIAVANFPMTGGTRAVPPGLQKEDAEAVRRLRAAGAVPIGLTNLHELAYGITSDNPHFGRVENPRARDRISGGSSGGAAAAVALGVVPISLGTDTAGSIRIPAACCGVVGMKPSYDLVPRTGAMTLAWSLDHIGPLAANVADVRTALAIMSGGGPEGGISPAPRTNIRLVRPANFFFDILEPSLRACIEKVLAALSRAGVDIVEREIADIENAAAAQFATICAEATQANLQRLDQAPEHLGEDVRVRLEAGRFILASDYVAAQRFRTHLLAVMVRALEGCDALITPTIAVGAPNAGVQHVDVDGVSLPIHAAMTRCTAPFNLTGMPAITLPCGMDRDGLPVGIQIAGRPGDDARLLDIAAVVEAEIGVTFA